MRSTRCFLVLVLVTACTGSSPPAHREEQPVGVEWPRDGGDTSTTDDDADADTTDSDTLADNDVTTDEDAPPTCFAPPPTCATNPSLDTFEDAQAVDNWYASDWASATLTAGGAPAPLTTTTTGASQGSQALRIPLRFVGTGYAQGMVGKTTSLNAAFCGALAMDVNLPANAPSSLRAKIILFSGPNGEWRETDTTTTLMPGGTVTLKVALAGAIEALPPRHEWTDLKGYGLKVEGDDLTYQGEVRVDNVRFIPLEKATPESMPRSVGTFGGFARTAGDDIPTENGFPTFLTNSRVDDHPMIWPKLGTAGARFTLGAVRFAGGSGIPPWEFVDWTTLRATANLTGGPTAQARMSRTFPATRYSSTASSFVWRSTHDGKSAVARMATVLNNTVAITNLATTPTVALSTMSEPWIILYAGPAAGWPFDAPVLFTFEKRPTQVSVSGGDVTFTFSGGTGAFNAMPLYGIKRLTTATTTAWDSGLPADVTALARQLVPVLAAFPIGTTETSAVDETRRVVTITTDFIHATYSDAWGTTPMPVAPVPPVVLQAGKHGYPVSYVNGTPVETAVATFFGPFAYVNATRVRYELPLPDGLTRLPTPLRVDNDSVASLVHAEQVRLLRDVVSGTPSTDFLDNDDRMAAFAASALVTYDAGSPEHNKALLIAPTLIEHGFLDSSLQTLTEPLSAQTYTNAAKYWASNEPFDKEWYTGRQLAALATTAEAMDLGLARGLWPKARGLYRYNQIFFDWATGSALSTVFGWAALADGMNFAWEGMLAMGRLAKILGDPLIYQDAAYRAARQQTALYEAWYQATWARDVDYAVEHLSQVKLAPQNVETRGAIDGYVEEFGTATLAFTSFWQTANFVYFNNPAQQSFYRDMGLLERVRALEYDIMPALHPNWGDGTEQNATDARYYASDHTAAHIVTRAALFHDDPSELFAIYNASANTPSASQWYTMRWAGTAGPTLLAIERSEAPVVEVPLTLVQVKGARFDAATGKIHLKLVGRTTGEAKVRVRQLGSTASEHTVAVCEGQERDIVLE